MKKYYSMVLNENEADIYIFGDIVEDWEKEWGFESDVSGLSLVNDVKDLDVDVINVHINSYGGVVSEGLAIYNTLKNHKAKIRTIVDGFACSAASVVFMAGDERLMNDASLLMIHNAWTRVSGNAAELRKQADDLEKITQASIEAYMSRVNITEDELKALLDAETWLLPSEALEKGFATSIVAETQTNKAAASAHRALFSLLKDAIDLQSAPKDEGEDGKIEEPDEPRAEATPEPQENKTLKFFNALMGGKE